MFHDDPGLFIGYPRHSGSQECPTWQLAAVSPFEQSKSTRDQPALLGRADGCEVVIPTGRAHTLHHFCKYPLVPGMRVLIVAEPAPDPAAPEITARLHAPYFTARFQECNAVHDPSANLLPPFQQLMPYEHLHPMNPNRATTAWLRAVEGRVVGATPSPKELEEHPALRRSSCAAILVEVPALRPAAYAALPLPEVVALHNRDSYPWRDPSNEAAAWTLCVEPDRLVVPRLLHQEQAAVRPVVAEDSSAPPRAPASARRLLQNMASKADGRRGTAPEAMMKASEALSSVEFRSGTVGIGNAVAGKRSARFGELAQSNRPRQPPPPSASTHKR